MAIRLFATRIIRPLQSAAANRTGILSPLAP